MIINIKSLTLILGIGVVNHSTAERSNLRNKRSFNQNDDVNKNTASLQQRPNLRASNERRLTTTLFNHENEEGKLHPFDVSESTEVLFDIQKAIASEISEKIVNGNGLETLLQSAALSEPEQLQETEGEKVATTSSVENTLTSNKQIYEENEAVSLSFTIANTVEDDEDLTKYKIGFYMRMAHPEGLDPIVSLPLCSNTLNDSMSSNCVSLDGGAATIGSVTFSSQTMEEMSFHSDSNSRSWPIDLYEYGTGMDAYILDGSGKTVVGPSKFRMLMSDS